jgi:serine protease AprX
LPRRLPIPVTAPDDRPNTEPASTMPALTSNYPAARAGEATLLPTPQRVSAPPDYSGRGVTIAFIDSGFYDHRDLRGRVRAYVDATTDSITQPRRIEKSLYTSWHGMMTSVIGCGDGATSGGRYRGIAPHAELVLIKISNPRGGVKEDDILRGLEWVLAHHARLNIRIVNLSVGGDYVSYDGNHPLHAVIRRLTEAGVLVVAAAGNRSVNYLYPPATSAEAITVGGLDDNNTDNRADWRLYGHNYGLGYDGSAKPDVVAPARWIPSPVMPGTSVAWEAFWIGAFLAAQHDHPVRKLVESGRANRTVEKLFGTAHLEDLLSTLQARAYQHKLIDTHHQHVDGTSVAAPLVSAVAALMLEARPTLSPAQLKHAIVQSAQPLGHQPSERQGAGVLDASAAVRLALAM